MSDPNATIQSMNEIKQKCQELADFFLPVFEEYWGAEDSKNYPSDEVIKFALFQNNLSFQIAFAVAYDLVDVSGLSEIAIEDINTTHEIMVAQTS